jgi:hypothetical protein
MVFPVFMAGKTGLTCDDLPCMGHMAGSASCTGVVTLLMQLGEAAMTGSAADHGPDFCLPQVACFAVLRHHRSRGIDSVTGNAVQRGSVACPVAKVAEDPFVRSLKRPWVPRLRTCRCRRSEGKEGPALRHRVAHGACAGEYFARLTDMAIVMASEAARPIAVANVVGIGRPVYFHGWEDITVVNPEDGSHRPV